MSKNPPSRKAYPILFMAVVFIVTFGTVFYHYVEKWDWIDAYYFCVVTLATVGYGDFVPHTDIGKLFTTIYILAGVGIIGVFANTLVRRAGNRVKHHAEQIQKQQ